MTKYCKQENIEMNCASFCFGSKLVLPTDSPASLELKDGDIIFAQTP